MGNKFGRGIGAAGAGIGFGAAQYELAKQAPTAFLWVDVIKTVVFGLFGIGFLALFAFIVYKSQQQQQGKSPAVTGDQSGVSGMPTKAPITPLQADPNHQLSV